MIEVDVTIVIRQRKTFPKELPCSWPLLRKEDGTLMYPHLQKFMPPVPSRFVQTRESTQAAISDTYNGDGKVYAALRAAAYVSWGIVTSLGAPSETGLRA